MTITELAKWIKDSGQDVEVVIGVEQMLPDAVLRLRVLVRGSHQRREYEQRILWTDLRSARLPMADIVLDDVLTEAIGRRRVPIEEALMDMRQRPRRGLDE